MSCHKVSEVNGASGVVSSYPNGHGEADMTKDGTIYWITTGIVCAVMVFSAVNFNFLLELERSSNSQEVTAAGPCVRAAFRGRHRAPDATTRHGHGKSC